MRDYPYLDKYIKEREDELMYPVQEPDDNIGGGKGSKISKPQEQMIITLDEDKRLNALRRQQRVIDDCLDDSDDITKTIARELYFKDHPTYTMTGLSKKLHYSTARLYRIQNKFLNKVAKKLNIYEP